MGGSAGARSPGAGDPFQKAHIGGLIELYDSIAWLSTHVWPSWLGRKCQPASAGDRSSQDRLDARQTAKVMRVEQRLYGAARRPNGHPENKIATPSKRNTYGIRPLFMAQDLVLGLVRPVEGVLISK